MAWQGPVDPKYSELSLNLQALSDSERQRLAETLSPQEISDVFENIKLVIAQEAKNRVQSKVALRFNHGYGIGELFNSIHEKVEGDSITVSSTQDYFAILNKGFSSFDMKEGKLGQRIKMRLPGGAIIYRMGPQKSDSDPRKKRKSLKAPASWIHPGLAGAHIYEEVAEEMKIWMTDYVNTRVNALLLRAKAPEGTIFNDDIYGKGKQGQKQYRVRGAKGRWANIGITNFDKPLREDLLRFKYKPAATGAVSPILPNTGKYTNPGEKEHKLKERNGFEGYHLNPKNFEEATRFDSKFVSQPGYHVGKSVLQTNGTPQPAPKRKKRR